MSQGVIEQVNSGELTWEKVASAAQEARNKTMENLRRKSTPVGLAYAQWKKREGKTLEELLERNTKKLYGSSIQFKDLATNFEKYRVYAAIVKSSGTPDKELVAAMKRLGPAGRGLLVLTLALSVYEVSTAESKVIAATREVNTVGAGIAGSLVAGKLAALGVVCGLGAPICIGAGAFIGGTLSDYVASWF